MQLNLVVRLVAVLAVLVAMLSTGRTTADETIVGGRYKFTPWKLGVNGGDSRDGFVISQVYGGYPANNLRWNRRPYTLEAGDRVVEVDGVELNRSWTLRKALGYSTGRVDLKVWDDRAGEYRSFYGVRLRR